MSVSLIKYLIIFILIPYFVGLIFVEKKENDNLAGLSYIFYSYMLGFVFMLAFFELICVPMHLAHIRLHVLFNTYNVATVLLLGVSIVLVLKKKRKLYVRIVYEKLQKTDLVYGALAILLIAVQLFFVVYYQSNWMASDDYEYVTKTSASLYTDYIVSLGSNNSTLKIISQRSFNSWEIFIAWLCKSTGINVPTMVHTVLNVTLVAIAFAVFYLIGCELFKKKNERIIFLLAIAFVNLFGLYSHYSLTFRLLMTMWQGKAVFMAIVFHFTILFLLKALRYDYSRTNGTVVCIISLASCALTPTGAGMFFLLLILTLLVDAIVNRRLYYMRYLVCGSVFPMVYFIGFLYFK